MATTPPRGYRAIACVLRAIMVSTTRPEWHGAEHLPQDKGFIAVSNHVTYADPLTLAHFLYINGHPPRFLAKAPLFDIPVIGTLLRYLEQIPVHRGSIQAKDAVNKGVEVLQRGDMIALFPEGTLTREPDLWPMVARTGTARMALETGVPVIPVAQWGAHRLLARYGKLLKPIPRKKVVVVAGPEIDLSEFRGRPLDAEVLRGATDAIMARLTAMVEELRGEKAPEVPFDMRKQGKS